MRSCFVRPNSVRAPGKRILRALPQSMRTFLNHTLRMVGSSTSGKFLGYGISAHWSALLNVIGYSDQSKYLGSATVSYLVIDMTCRAVTFYWHLLSKAAHPPKIVATVLLASWALSRAPLGCSSPLSLSDLSSLRVHHFCSSSWKALAMP